MVEIEQRAERVHMTSGSGMYRVNSESVVTLDEGLFQGRLFFALYSTTLKSRARVPQ